MEAARGKRLCYPINLLPVCSDLGCDTAGSQAGCLSLVFPGTALSTQTRSHPPIPFDLCPLLCFMLQCQRQPDQKVSAGAGELGKHLFCLQSLQHAGLAGFQEDAWSFPSTSH